MTGSPETDGLTDAIIRVVPKQGRSRATLDKLEDAIRQVLQDPAIGRDRFTTAQVAELAGYSIGTVYRYFYDRTAMLDHIWPTRGESFLPLAERTGSASGQPQV